MRYNDHEGADWYPGMELPSRKETHGRKKSDRKIRQEEKEPKEQMRETARDVELPAPPVEQSAEEQWQAYREEVAVTAAIPMPATPATDTEAVAEVVAEEDEGPVIARWKVALFCLFAPILLIAVLAYGKLAYVHQVPDFVRQHVPAYQSGEGFLILKPWWFGPPVFDLKSYPMDAGEEYTQWQLQLSDYAGVVQNPTVLYTFQQDILQAK